MENKAVAAALIVLSLAVLVLSWTIMTHPRRALEARGDYCAERVQAEAEGEWVGAEGADERARYQAVCQH